MLYSGACVKAFSLFSIPKVMDEVYYVLLVPHRGCAAKRKEEKEKPHAVGERRKMHDFFPAFPLSPCSPSPHTQKENFFSKDARGTRNKEVEHQRC